MAGDERPAFYALRPGGWRDYLTLLHPPYTAWHLSYVAIGAATAPRLYGVRLAYSLAAFFLGVGLAAHALDELRGRPLRTGISTRTLQAIAAVAVVGALGLGVYGAVQVSWWLLPFMAFGVFILLSYNLELFGGRFHTDLWFALSWGAFPAITASFAQVGFIRWPAIPVALGCALLSAAQRRLSTPVRRLRRAGASVRGRVRFRDGIEVEIDEAFLRSAPEAALRAMSAGLVLLAAGLVAARLT